MPQCSIEHVNPPASTLAYNSILPLLPESLNYLIIKGINESTSKTVSKFFLCLSIM